MPKKTEINAAGQEIAPVASNKPAPTAAASSNTNVAKKQPTAFQRGNHSAMVGGGQAKTSAITAGRISGRCPVTFKLVLEG